MGGFQGALEGEAETPSRLAYQDAWEEAAASLDDARGLGFVTSEAGTGLRGFDMF